MQLLYLIKLIALTKHARQFCCLSHSGTLLINLLKGWDILIVVAWEILKDSFKECVTMLLVSTLFLFFIKHVDGAHLTRCVCVSFKNQHQS